MGICASASTTNSASTTTSASTTPTFNPLTTSSVRVPEDCNTLGKAVELIQQHDCLTTLVAGKAEHQMIHGPYLEIWSAMNIVGDPGVPKEEIVILGGIHFKKGIQGNCHLQHLTLRQAKFSGVFGQSSFTMDYTFLVWY